MSWAEEREEEAQAVLAVVEGEHVSAAGWVRVHCPFCQHGAKKNLAYNTESTWYQCWRCGTKGFTDRKPREVHQVVLPPNSTDLPEEFVPFNFDSQGISSRRYYAYLSSRGVSLQDAMAAGVGYCPRGKYANSLLVPVVSQGKHHGFVARSISTKEYRYPPGMERGKYFFNHDRLVATNGADEVAIIVEGVFDALPHFPYAVACLGKPSALHFELMMQYPGTLCIALDADAQDEGWIICKKLQLSGVVAKFVKLPPGLDPGKISRGDFLVLCGIDEQRVAVC